MENRLANTIRVGLILILITPLIVTVPPIPVLFFPYIVGKALYSRLLIELVFAMWLVLAFWYPAYRPPRSRLIFIFSIYVLVALVASFFGVSPIRSIWSTYERMQGWIDVAHWLVFTVVASSTLKTFRDWRMILNFNLAIGLIMGLLGIAQLNGLDLFGYLGSLNRLVITLGNATFVGAYMLVNALIALAFLSHSFASTKVEPENLRIRSGRRGRRAKARIRANQGFPISSVTLIRAFWILVILLDLTMLIQSGTRGAIMGLFAGLALFGVSYIFWGKLRSIKIASITILSLFATLGVAFVSVKDTDTFRDAVEPVVLLRRLASISLDDPSTKGRIDSAMIGLEGFIERPVLGWGAENYTIAYDQNLTANVAASSLESFDQAHNKLIEELVTKGIIGLACYIAIWFYIAWIVTTRVRYLRSDIQLFVLVIAAALASYFVQNLFLFDTPGTVVQLYLLISFMVYFESIPVKGSFETDDSDAKGVMAIPSRLGAITFLRAELAQVIALIVIGAAMVVLIYFMVIGPYVASRSLNIAVTGRGAGTWTDRIIYFQDSIQAAPGLANYARRFMFDALEINWMSLTVEEKVATLNLADKEGKVAMEAEPMEWRFPFYLAGIYHRAAIHNPEFAQIGRKHTEKALELAPERVELQQLLARQFIIESNYEGALAVIDDYLDRNSENLEPGDRVHQIFTNLRERIQSSADSQ